MIGGAAFQAIKNNPNISLFELQKAVNSSIPWYTPFIFVLLAIVIILIIEYFIRRG